jgi:hypothetical protein
LKFFIEDITRRNGETRTNGKYPNRIGSTIEFLNPVEVGEPAYFRYIKYNNGELVEDHVTRTSRVNDLEWYSGNFYIYTRNSIYKFVPVEDNTN